MKGREGDMSEKCSNGKCVGPDCEGCSSLTPKHTEVEAAGKFFERVDNECCELHSIPDERAHFLHELEARDLSVRSEERELCAKIAEGHTKDCHGITHGDCAESIAEAIRKGD